MNQQFFQPFGRFVSDSVSSKDLIWLVLLVSWMPLKVRTKPWQIIEFFSGRGRLSQLAAKAGFQVASFDINRGRNYPKKRSSRHKKRHFDKRLPMDMNGEVGFAYLACIQYIIYFNYFQHLCLHLVLFLICQSDRLSPLDVAPPLRLCIAMCLQACFGLVMVLATVCSTWVAVNVGTSKRCSLVPQGSTNVTANRRGNKMVARSCGSKCYRLVYFSICLNFPVFTEVKYITICLNVSRGPNYRVGSSGPYSYYAFAWLCLGISF